MAPLRIGSLFTGTGALDLAVMDVFDAEVVWHSQYEPPDKNGKEDKNQYAAKILERHWPATPNLGDITKVDWQAVLARHGRIDIVTGGFPCTDVSSAGKRAGLTPETRSGLWNHMARCIAVLRPRLVVIENVEGLLSAEADRGLESGTEVVGEGPGAGGVLRALGAVLGDLATLGFHAEWARVAASEVGAPHPRKRVFVYAWSAAADSCGVESERRGEPGVVRSAASAEPGEGHQRERSGDSAGDGGETAADTQDLGYERDRAARGRRPGSADGDLAAAHPGGPGLEVGRVEPAGYERAPAERGNRESAADATCHPGRVGYGDDVRAGRGEDRREPPAGRGEAASHACGVVPGDDCELPSGRDAIRRGVRDDAPRCGATPADAQGVGRGQGRPEPARFVRGSHAAIGGGFAASDTDSRRWRAEVLELRPGQPDVDWGDYGPAISRWEAILGRPAPWPTDLRGRLSPVFSEWMMGLPDGWVTCTPGPAGMSAASLRNAMLRALGNGVVRLQAVAALVLLHQRAAGGGTVTPNGKAAA